MGWHPPPPTAVGWNWQPLTEWVNSTHSGIILSRSKNREYPHPFNRKPCPILSKVDLEKISKIAEPFIQNCCSVVRLFFRTSSLKFLFSFLWYPMSRPTIEDDFTDLYQCIVLAELGMMEYLGILQRFILHSYTGWSSACKIVPQNRISFDNA